MELHGTKSCRCWKRHARSDPDDADTWARTRQNTIASTTIKGAEAFARRALEIDPENSDAMLTMGYLLLHRKRDARSEGARTHRAAYQSSLHEGAVRLARRLGARQKPAARPAVALQLFFGGGSMARTGRAVDRRLPRLPRTVIAPMSVNRSEGILFAILLARLLHHPTDQA